MPQLINANPRKSGTLPKQQDLYTSESQTQLTAIPLDIINQELADAPAENLVEWADNTFGSGLVMSTSFGIQSAVTLHLVCQIIPNIPVIWVDTGYLPTETYKFADELTKRLNLNLNV
ncbi:MAG: phosphoadenosine phosphosulfate reductase family protein, partial [Microcoleaceae cyanobacterium]